MVAVLRLCLQLKHHACSCLACAHTWQTGHPVCVQVGDAGVVAIARLCPQLAALGLHCCRRLTDAAVDAAAAHLRHLTSLNVSGCVSLSPAAVQARRGTSMRHNTALCAILASTDSPTRLLKQDRASGC